MLPQGQQYVCAGELVALQTMTNVLNYLKVQKIDIAKVLFSYGVPDDWLTISQLAHGNLYCRESQGNAWGNRSRVPRSCSGATEAGRLYQVGPWLRDYPSSWN